MSATSTHATENFFTAFGPPFSRDANTVTVKTTAYHTELSAETIRGFKERRQRLVSPPSGGLRTACYASVPLLLRFDHGHTEIFTGFLRTKPVHHPCNSFRESSSTEQRPSRLPGFFAPDETRLVFDPLTLWLRAGRAAPAIPTALCVAAHRQQPWVDRHRRCALTRSMRRMPTRSTTGSV